MTILPVGNRLLISPTENKIQKSEGGIDLIQNTLSEGIVVEVSGDLKNLFSVDDTVIFPEGAGQIQPYNGKVCMWINANDVWAIVKQNS